MRQMTNLECSFIIRELAQLEGKHFSKMYQMGENSFRMKIGDFQVIIDLPIRIGLAKYIRKESEPGQFVQKLRKILNNQKLVRAYQCGNDRIIAFNFENNVLFFELFAKGNAILVDKEGKIISALKEERWKDRTIAKGEEYKEPPSNFTNSVEKALTEKYTIVCLLNLPLGKDYAKDMLERCGIDEKKPANLLSESEISCLKSEYTKILENQKPYLFLDSGKPIDYGLAKLKKYETFETKEMSSLSEAMEEFYANAPEKKKNERLEKLKHRLSEQLAQLEAQKLKEKEAREKGDFIYSHYQEIEKILEIAKKAGIKNAKEALKKQKYNVLTVNGERKEVEVEF